MSVYLVNSESEDGETQSGSITGVITEATHALHHFWPRVTEEIRHIGCSMDLRTQALPLARIKKIMKLDEDVKMISAEAPVLFAKAAELFIQELTLRSWVHTEDNKRRTLQRNDIAMAITKYDQFDFLIDIVPREEPRAGPRSHVCLDQVHYYLQLNQQGGGQQQQTSSGSSEERMDQRQHVPILQDTVQTVALQEAKPVSGNIQVVQQIMTPSGDVQHVPVQIPDRQMELIRLQVESQAPIVLTQPQLIQVRQQNPVYIDSSASPTN